MKDNPTEAYGDYTGAEEGVTIERRSYLKMALSAVTAMGLGTGVASADGHGYGDGGYGEGVYGGQSEIVVTTEPATTVGTTTATLHGTVEGVEESEIKNCSFKWRPVGTNSWETADGGSLSSGTFSARLDGLRSGQRYEYRAEVVTADNLVKTGGLYRFRTDGIAPTIDSYSIVEAGSPNPHWQCTVDWSVSDSEGDLDKAIVTVYDRSGSIADSSVTEITGDSASGREKVDVKHARNEEFEVYLTVVDTSGNSATRVEIVSE